MQSKTSTKAQKSGHASVLGRLSISQSILVVTMGIVTLGLTVSGIVYFALFSSTSRALIEAQSREINKQIVLNFESYIESIIETANYLQYSSHKQDIAQDYSTLQRLYQLNSEIKKDVPALFLFDAKGNKLLGDALRPMPAKHIARAPWFLRAMEEPAIFHFSPVGETSLARGHNAEVVSLSKQISYIRNGLSHRGVLRIELNFQVIRNLASTTDLGLGGHLLIISDDDSLVYSSSRSLELTEDSLNAAVSHILGGMKTHIGTYHLFMNINTLEYTRWRIATFINIDGIDAIRRSMISGMLIILAAFMILTAVTSGFLSLRISRPVRELQRIMRAIEEGGIFTDIKVNGQREIVMLGQSFHSMIITIRELMDRVVAEQREKRKTELRALQNQINPHFLYNSLDSIVWLAEHNRSEDVITAVVALARFFRISISRGATFIPVADEIAHVKNYLTIQAIRYSGRFTYTFHIDEKLLGRKVMKLILQPLVENAIHHGIEDEGGIIEIFGFMKEQFMTFEVRNSGYGLTEGKIAAIHALLDRQPLSGESPSRNHGTGGREEGVGLRNVHQRLKLYYGEEAGLRFSSIADEWTIVTLRIPLNVHGQEDK